MLRKKIFYISIDLRNTVSRCCFSKSFSVASARKLERVSKAAGQELLPRPKDFEKSVASLCDSDQALGGLRSMPKLLPCHEYVGIAAKKAKAVEVDNTIRNSRIRGCKHAAAILSTFSKELTKPLGSAVDGFKIATSGLLRLHQFERILVTLTLRNMQREGHGTLETAISAVKSLRKETSICIKSYISAGANAPSAKEVTAPTIRIFARTIDSIVDLGNLTRTADAINCP
jgi:hypothetical protein